MSTELLAGLIAAAVSLLGGVAGYVTQSRLLARQVAVQEAATEEERFREAERIRSKYRDPLLAAAGALQSRIYNIVKLDVLSLPETNVAGPGGRSYYLESTLYVLAEYLGWREILRREIQFLDLGNDDTTHAINDVLAQISNAMARTDHGLGAAFRLFRLEQRAVGELVIRRRTLPGEDLVECMGPAEFARRIDTPDFRRWLGPVEAGLADLPAGNPADIGRLSLIQNWLVCLLNHLDPQVVAVPGPRSPIPLPDELEDHGPPG